VARGELERTPFIAPFADGEAAVGRFPGHGRGGQVFFLAV